MINKLTHDKITAVILLTKSKITAVILLTKPNQRNFVPRRIKNTVLSTQGLTQQ